MRRIKKISEDCAATTYAAITDGSGGTANDSTGIGTVGGSYSQTVVANAIATLARGIARNAADIAAVKANLGL